MFKQEIDNVSALSLKKKDMLNNSKLKYIAASLMAGIFVGFGVIISNTIGGLYGNTSTPQAKIAMGISFGGALSLVLMAGAELFTGNNMVMFVGILDKKTGWKDAGKVWLFCYIGNFIGSIVIAGLFVLSGMAKGSTADMILKASAAKMSAPFIQLIARGILCNMLVCLAVWCSYRMKDETAKLVITFWCLFTFVASGFEHSVANMTLFSAALMIPHSASVSMTGLLYNLSAVTIGNIFGGAVMIGLVYWFISTEKGRTIDQAVQDDKLKA